MPLPSFLQSLNCASSRSSEIQRRTSSLGRKKSGKKSNINKSDKTDSSNTLGPSAPPIGQNSEKSDIVQTVQDSLLKRKESVISNNEESISFWEIGNYKYTLQRCDNGFKLGSDFADMIAERAKLEETYAKSIKNWHKKWNNYLQTESTECQATKNGWIALLETGNKTAQVHMELCNTLINKPVLKVKDWLKKKYEKHYINFKQTKEFENEFEGAEKSWVTLNDKLKKHKKEYYESIRHTKQCEETARSAQTNPKINPEQREKLDEKANKAREDEDKARKRYKDTLVEMDLYKPRHMEKMKEVYDKTQNFEQERILFFKQTLYECYEILQIQSDERFDQLFANYLNEINSINPKEDLDWWSQHFGVDTHPVWPAFEEYQSS